MTPYTDLCLTLTPEQEALKQGVHQFARHVLRPAAMALDRVPDPQQVIDSNSLRWTTLKSAYAQGFHTALVPRACGGLGLQGLDLHLALEELGWGSADFAASIAVAGFPFSSVAATGNAALIDELVRPRGEEIRRGPVKKGTAGARLHGRRERQRQHGGDHRQRDQLPAKLPVSEPADAHHHDARRQIPDPCSVPG